MRPQPKNATRERILDQAEQLFADHGFDAVSVRQITTAANTNLAAVNYHFGSKKELYLDVFRERWIPRAKRITNAIKAQGNKGRPSMESLIRSVAEAFLVGFSDEKERVRHLKLIHMEILSPTGALELILRDALLPTVANITGLMKPLMPEGSGSQKLLLCFLSVLSQALYFSFGRPIVSQTTGLKYDEKAINTLVDHIVGFSMHGMNGNAPEGPRQ